MNNSFLFATPPKKMSETLRSRLNHMKVYHLTEPFVLLLPPPAATAQLVVNCQLGVEKGRGQAGNFQYFKKN